VNDSSRFFTASPVTDFPQPEGSTSTRESLFDSDNTGNSYSALSTCESGRHRQRVLVQKTPIWPPVRPGHDRLRRAKWVDRGLTGLEPLRVESESIDSSAVPIAPERIR